MLISSVNNAFYNFFYYIITVGERRFSSPPCLDQRCL